MKRLNSIVLLALVTVSVFVICCNEDSSSVQSDVDTEAVKSGWQPEEACHFLAEVPGLDGRAYKNWTLDYSCSSPYKVLTGSPIENNLAYYAYGTKNTVNKLELVLNLNDMNEADLAIDFLLKIAELLAEESLGTGLSDKVVSAIKQGASANQSEVSEITPDGHKIRVYSEKNGRVQTVYYQILNSQE